MVKIFNVEYNIPDPRPEREGLTASVGAKVAAQNMIKAIHFIECNGHKDAEVISISLAQENKRINFDYEDNTVRFV